MSTNQPSPSMPQKEVKTSAAALLSLAAFALPLRSQSNPSCVLSPHTVEYVPPTQWHQYCPPSAPAQPLPPLPAPPAIQGVGWNPQPYSLPSGPVGRSYYDYGNFPTYNPFPMPLPTMGGLGAGGYPSQPPPAHVFSINMAEVEQRIQNAALETRFPASPSLVGFVPDLQAVDAAARGQIAASVGESRAIDSDSAWSSGRDTPRLGTRGELVDQNQQTSNAEVDQSQSLAQLKKFPGSMQKALKSMVTELNQGPKPGLFGTVRHWYKLFKAGRTIYNESQKTLRLFESASELAGAATDPADLSAVAKRFLRVEEKDLSMVDRTLIGTYRAVEDAYRKASVPTVARLNPDAVRGIVSDLDRAVQEGSREKIVGGLRQLQQVRRELREARTTLQSRYEQIQQGVTALQEECRIENEIRIPLAGATERFFPMMDAFVHMDSIQPLCNRAHAAADAALKRHGKALFFNGADQVQFDALTSEAQGRAVNVLRQRL